MTFTCGCETARKFVARTARPLFIVFLVVRPLLSHVAVFQGPCTKFSPCRQICVDLSTSSGIGAGHHCACRAGFRLTRNGFSCGAASRIPAREASWTLIDDEDANGFGSGGGGGGAEDKDSAHARIAPHDPILHPYNPWEPKNNPWERYLPWYKSYYTPAYKSEGKSTRGPKGFFKGFSTPEEPQRRWPPPPQQQKSTTEDSTFLPEQSENEAGEADLGRGKNKGGGTNGKGKRKQRNNVAKIRWSKNTKNKTKRRQPSKEKTTTTTSIKETKGKLKGKVKTPLGAQRHIPTAGDPSVDRNSRLQRLRATSSPSPRGNSEIRRRKVGKSKNFERIRKYRDRTSKVATSDDNNKNSSSRLILPSRRVVRLSTPNRAVDVSNSTSPTIRSRAKTVAVGKERRPTRRSETAAAEPPAAAASAVGAAGVSSRRGPRGKINSVPPRDPVVFDSPANKHLQTDSKRKTHEVLDAEKSEWNKSRSKISGEKLDSRKWFVESRLTKVDTQPESRVDFQMKSTATKTETKVESKIKRPSKIGSPMKSRLLKVNSQIKSRSSKVHSEKKILPKSYSPKDEFQSARRPRSCDGDVCLHGGECLADGARCLCPLGRGGVACERLVEAPYPHFTGASFLTFPPVLGAADSFAIRLVFRPDADRSGVLVLSSAPDAADRFSVSLRRGVVEFSFDCGSGAARLRSYGRVLTGQWNVVEVHRTGNWGWLKLNGGPSVKGKSKGVLSSIAVKGPLYVGGVPEGATARRRKGFVGCVKQLRIDGVDYDFRRQPRGGAIRGVDVDDCSRGACRRADCRNGATCLPDSPDSFVCVCPLGFQGRACEEPVILTLPRFDGTRSFLQFKGLGPASMHRVEIELIFKPESPDGLLLYNGFEARRLGDFVSLSLNDSFLEFRFDLGTGVALLRSRRRLRLGAWHSISAVRSGREGRLRVDDQGPVDGVSPGVFTQLTLRQPLFVGGADDFGRVNKFAGGGAVAFRGCVQRLAVGGVPLDFLRDTLSGRHVVNCDGHPCVTDDAHPCGVDGVCVPDADKFSCDCPLGRFGRRCEDKSDQPVVVPSFDGRSWLRHDSPEIRSRVNRDVNDFFLRFKTQSPQGLLLWTGPEQAAVSDLSSLPDQDLDYLFIGLVDGRLRFGFDLGGGAALLVSRRAGFDDGQWHRLRALRNATRAALSVDGVLEVSGSSQGSQRQLNASSPLFVGGLPGGPARATRGRFLHGLRGCVSHVVIGADHHVQLVADAGDGANVGRCTDVEKEGE